MMLDDITSSFDEEYADLVAFVHGRQSYKSAEKPHIAKLFRNVIDDLSIRQVNGVNLVVLQGTGIVVPTSACKRVVHELHNAHSGFTKSVMTAQQLYY